MPGWGHLPLAQIYGDFLVVVIAWRNCQRADRLPKLGCSSVAITGVCPMRDRDATESVGVPVVPSCRNCHESSQVRPVPLSEKFPDVQYWRCDRCGFVWATRDGEDLRTLGQQSSGKSA
jgi:hypothetical protein